jgi:hypothetical protein
MGDFPERPLSNHDNRIHEDEQLADPAYDNAPLLGGAFNLHQFLPIDKVDFTERTGEGVDGVCHLDFLHLKRV